MGSYMATLATIIAAFITGVIGPVSIFYLNKLQSEKHVPQPEAERTSHLEGKWKVFFFQKIAGKNKRLETIINLRKVGKYFEGDATLNDEVLGKSSIIIYNGVFNGRILKIDYRNSKPRIFQYGAAVLLMNNEGTQLAGTYVGFSPKFDKVVCGDITFCEKLET
jgi:hypothetical protein